MNNNSILFIGALVPETSEYMNEAFNRSGNQVQEGLCDGFYAQGVRLNVLSSRPIPSAPKCKKIYCNGNSVDHHGYRIKFIPFINIILIKTFCSTIYSLLYAVKWAIQNRNNRRYILVYNVSTPPLMTVYWVGKITRSKSIAILYDLGVPPKSLKLGLLRQGIYQCMEVLSRRYIPKIDGRIVINTAIANDYAHGKDYLLVDGGITNDTVQRLFYLSPTKNKKRIFLCAGSLWRPNGTEMIIQSMKVIDNPNIEVWFAGRGVDVPEIEAAMQTDSRIKYLGMLSSDALFEVYKKVDVLLNIRIMDDGEGQYLFPSKIIEYLTVGRYVITTSVAHIEQVYGSICKVLNDNTQASLVEAIQETASMPEEELLETGKTARQYMLSTHTWENQSKQIISYINQLK